MCSRIPGVLDVFHAGGAPVAQEGEAGHVPNGPHPFLRGPHVPVHNNAPVLRVHQESFAEEVCARPGPHSNHGQGGVEALVGGQHHALQLAVRPAFKRLHHRPFLQDLDALFHVVVLVHVGHLLWEQAHQEPIVRENHGGLDAVEAELGGHFHANVPAPNHHRLAPSHGRGGLGLAGLDSFHEVQAIGHVPQVVYSLQSAALARQLDGHRSCSYNQVLERYFVSIRNNERFRNLVHLCNLCAGHNLNTVVFIPFLVLARVATPHTSMESRQPDIFICKEGL
mmetsp:Transcript_13975/g.20606  ORF Transcript_13975/g.20606 Transcript_13975/m.20606 type:complete len:281 (-) Transcript_13975:109-951(-)